MPTAEEISAAAEEIRRGWSHAELLRREVRLANHRQQPKPPPKWSVPVVHCDRDVMDWLISNVRSL